MELLAGRKTYVIGAALIALGVLVLLGLSVQALPGVLVILGGLGLIALRLGTRKAELAALDAEAVLNKER